MANLTAVLRKTIDGLPNATPHVRAKVYEKARAAITRQIEAADPPLDPALVEARRRALEDAIAETESVYAAAPVDAPPEPSAPPEPAASSEPAASPEPFAPPEPSDRPSAATPTFEPVAAPERVVPASENAVVAPKPEPRSTWTPRRANPVPPQPEPPSDSSNGQTNAGTETPSLTSQAPSSVRELEPNEGPLFSGIPEAGSASSRHRAGSGRRRRAPIAAGLAVLALAGAAGAAGYVYQDEIRALIADTQTKVAATPAVQTTDAGEATNTAALETPGPTPAPPKGAPVESAAPAATDAPAGVDTPAGTDTPAGAEAPVADTNSAHPRQFTQRLLADGSEVDEGAGTRSPNAFEEGTDVATASLAVAPPASPEAAIADAASSAAAAQTASVQPTPEPGPVPVAQKAVFYEERSGNAAGSQRGGNVVWSVVNEPPAEGQPPEPAIRAVADVPEENLKMTMTIRRNADSTLPASHVIELMFDVPKDFAGGTIENVQRLALKPTEQARGEPLIGVAGKISDGFFIIALNDLQQAIQSNLNLMGTEQWIDIPLAYSTGQRALMSIEKGIPGERVFKQAMDAWATKT